MIKINSSGQGVKDWQSFLIQKSYLHDTADGVFGPKTQAATIAFQSENGLTPDGIVGPATIAKAVSLGYVVSSATSQTSSNFPPSDSLDAIFDISHWNQPASGKLDFAAAKAAGMLAVFHKLTDGATGVDATYNENKRDAIAAGLLWGAYHFAEKADGVAQANNFLNHAGSNGDTLLVLDFERGQGGDMTASQAVNFIETVYQKTGKYPGLYGGEYLKSIMDQPEAQGLSKCWLWLSEYGRHAKLPAGWDRWTLWQYTDGHIGPNPIQVPGIGACDRDLYNGDEAGLRQFWNNHAV